MSLSPDDPGFGEAMFAKYGRALRPGDEEYEAAMESLSRFTARLHRQQRRWRRRTGALEVGKLAWGSVWRMGMYSADPTVARMAIVHTAQQELRNQRALAAQQQAATLAQDDERARAFADAFMDRLEERMGGRPS